MATVIEKALDKIKKIKVEEIEKPKQSNKGLDIFPYDERPVLYLSDKILSSTPKFKAGDKVILAVECTVNNCSCEETMTDTETKKSFSASLRIDAIADITSR